VSGSVSEAHRQDSEWKSEILLQKGTAILPTEFLAQHLLSHQAFQMTET